MLTLTNEVKSTLSRQAIEVPSWAFGNSGRVQGLLATRCAQGSIREVADAAQVHRFTGLAPTVALHIPSGSRRRFRQVRSLRRRTRHPSLGTINTNTFQDDDYKLGSLCHVDEAIRSKAVGHALECIDIMNIVGSNDLKIWLPDGFNYPGQGDLRDRQDRLADSLGQIYARLSETSVSCSSTSSSNPAFYSTDVPDWGTAYVQCLALGERAVVCLDTGHHAPGTNIEFIVMQLLRLGKLGAFDFNSRFYADDDLMVGAADPFQLFRILCEVARGGGFDAGSRVHFMLDQCHNIKAKFRRRFGPFSTSRR